MVPEASKCGALTGDRDRVHHRRPGAVRRAGAGPDAGLADRRDRPRGPDRRRHRPRAVGGIGVGRHRGLLRRDRARHRVPPLRAEAAALGPRRVPLPEARRRRRPVSGTPQQGGHRPDTIGHPVRRCPDSAHGTNCPRRRSAGCAGRGRPDREPCLLPAPDRGAPRQRRARKRRIPDGSHAFCSSACGRRDQPWVLHSSLLLLAAA